MSLLPSHRQGLYLLEHCRVMVKDEQLTYVQQKDGFQKYFAIPYANTNVLLLGTGTSITQPATRLLAEAGVLLGFTGGGGTPLFLASQNEYRPTQYLQAWVKMWQSTANRLKVYQYFQQQRCSFLEDSWRKLDAFEKVDLNAVIHHYQTQILCATNGQTLMGYEANFARQLYRIAAEITGGHHFERKPGSGETGDRFNRYLDHGNYLAYGLAATVLWVLGIPHSLPVAHGMTRRGALVFDVADMIKDATILPNAFISAANQESDQQMRNRCIAFFDQTKTLRFLFDHIKAVTEMDW
ncbi:type I-F CRISPR-associated endonuclease Cas1 [Endozoicomonas sp. SM1973]|uniref:Type I-F CRISPR-associated endonuclease Cas1 n=1 Tax=Spartinivicinus marinus TaxID=2994442 RepID=A0A853IB60_9GAMM|nr:type I-F CRISPR-associated endonuclease Cas1f [Spartinivicinus marinus]MCX4030215.1 type I-F CRISPR-associated endonuclease Cas1f [Spartinivicinus marinus]NYZ67858.1 type I-F CRISPR-associated endonuclease Cas1 [Spartinivicinus marinus]